jgi:hypothetical protein
MPRFPPRGPRGRLFPRFDGTTKALRLPAGPPAALRCLRLAVPWLHPDFALGGAGCVSAEPGVGHPVSPAGICHGDDRISQVPGEPRLPICTWSQTPAGRPVPDHSERTRGPGWRHGQGSREKQTFEAQYMAFGLAVYASWGQVTRPPRKTRFQVLVNSPGRAFHPQGSAERFLECNPYIPPPFPSLLGASPFSVPTFRAMEAAESFPPSTSGRLITPWPFGRRSGNEFHCRPRNRGDLTSCRP